MNIRFPMLIAASLVASAASAGTLFTFNAGEPGQVLDGGFFNIGTEFSVGPSGLQTSAIGAFVNESDVTRGLTNTPFTASLYSKTGADTGALISTVVIPVGTPVDASGFAYAPLSAALTGSSNYVVSDFRGTSALPASSTPFAFAGFASPTPTAPIGTFGSGTAFIENRYNSDPNTANFPSSTNGGFSQFLGANLQFTTTPEPSSIVLLVVGVFGLFVAFGRRRG